MIQDECINTSILIYISENIIAYIPACWYFEIFERGIENFYNLARTKTNSTTTIAALEIDTSMYSKIERSERAANRKQIVVIAQFLINWQNTLVTLWFVDKIIVVIGKDKEFIEKAFKIVEQNIKSNNLYKK
jgi:hypothetical protein